MYAIERLNSSGTLQRYIVSMLLVRDNAGLWCFWKNQKPNKNLTKTVKQQWHLKVEKEHGAAFRDAISKIKIFHDNMSTPMFGFWIIRNHYKPSLSRISFIESKFNKTCLNLCRKGFESKLTKSNPLQNFNRFDITTSWIKHIHTQRYMSQRGKSNILYVF